jgi:hypothetical protein
MAGNVAQLARQFLIIAGSQDEPPAALDVKSSILQLVPFLVTCSP